MARTKQTKRSSKKIKRDNQNSNKARSHNVKKNDDNEEGIYTVEKILAHRLSTAGHVQYKVKWAGYDEKESCWVNATDVFAPNLVTRYWNDRKMNSSAQSSKYNIKNNQSDKEFSTSNKNAQVQNNSKRPRLRRNKTKTNTSMQ